MEIHKGSQKSFNLTEGKYKIMFLLKDNRYFFSEVIDIKPNGKNYYSWNSLKILNADQFSKSIDSSVKVLNYHGATDVGDQIMDRFNDKTFDRSQLLNKMSGRIIDERKEPLQWVTVKVAGISESVISDQNGFFKINTPVTGKIYLAFIGF